MSNFEKPIGQGQEKEDSLEKKIYEFQSETRMMGGDLSMNELHVVEGEIEKFVNDHLRELGYDGHIPETMLVDAIASKGFNDRKNLISRDEVTSSLKELLQDKEATSNAVEKWKSYKFFKRLARELVSKAHDIDSLERALGGALEKIRDGKDHNVRAAIHDELRYEEDEEKSDDQFMQGYRFPYEELEDPNMSVDNMLKLYNQLEKGRFIAPPNQLKERRPKKGSEVDS